MSLTFRLSTLRPEMTVAKGSDGFAGCVSEAFSFDGCVEMEGTRSPSGSVSLLRHEWGGSGDGDCVSVAVS